MALLGFGTSSPDIKVVSDNRINGDIVVLNDWKRDWTKFLVDDVCSVFKNKLNGLLLISMVMVVCVVSIEAPEKASLVNAYKISGYELGLG
ncbi:hypothetical protein Tco_0817049 [Tanacetum coccineum]